MNCQQIDKYLFEYCSNKLSPESQQEFMDHLQHCQHCRVLVDFTLLEDDILIEAADVPHLKDDFTLRVMQQVSAAAPHPVNAPVQSKTAPGARRTPLFYLGGGIAVAVILLALFIPGILNLTYPKSSVHLADSNISRQESQMQADKNIPVRLGSLGEPERVVGPDSADTANIADAPGSADAVPRDRIEAGSLSADSGQHAYPAITTTGGYETQPSRTSSASQESLLAEKAHAKKSLQQESRYGNNLMRLQPDNLPPEYKLDKIIYTSQDEITYQYLMTGSQETLAITITPIALDQADPASVDSIPRGFQAMMDTPANEASSADVSLANETQVVLELNNNTYRVDFSANMPINDLNYIANTIIFKEDLNLEPSLE